MIELQHQWVEVEGLRIHLLCAGAAAETILLLHGGGIDSAWLSWQPIIPTISENYRVLAPDLPGYGESARPDISYTMAFYVDFVAALLEVLRLERVTLVGVSMGGGIAIGLTLAHPERVRRLVPVDSYGLQRQAPAHRWSYWLVHLEGLNRLTWGLMARSRSLVRLSLQQIFHDPRKVDAALVEAVFEEVRKPHAGRAFRSFQRHEVLKAGLRTVYLERLGEIRAPTLFIHGEHDPLVPLAAAREAHQRLPGSRLAVLPHCGHWPQREDPTTFSQILRGFLAET
ncbi:alpha/beta hydrolase [uncultured Thermanaerothrix sp.]|uniref:alpha/beta fold hydrolase n=1 Tax=uncultured Thermanaerothrix sp. TaxID=1195149 RepID=UPI00261A96E5|nr:alpha/beta hydrolase [uncultured Thermanaerothrix sp.]